MAGTNFMNIYHLLFIWIAGSNKFDITWKIPSVNPAVTHKFLNETNGLSCVCLIKEEYGISFVLAVLYNLLFHLCNHVNNILFRCPSMYLHITGVTLLTFHLGLFQLSSKIVREPAKWTSLIETVTVVKTKYSGLKFRTSRFRGLTPSLGVLSSSAKNWRVCNKCKCYVVYSRVS